MIEKDLAFLKETPFFDSGLYDNQHVFENTVGAINAAAKNNIGCKINLRATQDNVIICFKDSTLMRLIHVEDKVKDCTYENISYIAKFPILTLNEVIELTKNIPVIFELEEGNLDYKLRIMDVLSSYEGKYAIESKDINTLKWFRKNYKKVPIGYKIDKYNMHRFHIFHGYDFVDVDTNVFADAVACKYKKEYLLLGHNVKDDDSFDSKKLTYDNLICESQLEK